MINSNTHRIRRVVARAHSRDRYGSETRLRNLLRELDWRVPTLTDETILCVRRMRLPPPRKRRPPASVEFQPPVELQNSVSTSLAGLARDAARPALGPVPANANAVFFADRAELLACLARDWCGGMAAARWWWSVLFPGDAFGAAVRRAWLKDARPVPAALVRLEAAGLASQFLAKFPPADLAALWRNIVHAFQLDAFEAAWSATESARMNSAPAPPSRESAPWSAWIVPPVSLGMEGARVLIAAILLERAPATIRSLSFAHEVRAWSQSKITHHVPEAPSNGMSPFPEEVSRKSDLPPAAVVSAGPPSLLDHDPMSDVARVEPTGPPSAEGNIGAPEAPRLDSLVSASSSHVESRTSGPSLDLPGPPRPQKNSPGIRRHENQAGPVHVEEEEPALSISAAVDESIALPAAALPDCISTAWGGSLYLVNIAIALEFYGDFSAPGRRGLALPLWDFLALLGDRMIGEEFAEDPLSSLFARLAGRGHDEPPAAQFEPPTGEPLAIWLAQVCQDVEGRVTAALGLDDGCDLRPLLLNHHAKIETTAERLDAHFSLAKHPIELRLAGLDRDPGWVPAGGRGIYFHYD